jgi:hypothetical protein
MGKGEIMVMDETTCRNSMEPWEPKNPCTSYGNPGFKRLQELHKEAGLIRGTICHNKCIFSRTCGKKGQDVIGCPVVIEERGDNTK